MKIGIIGDGAIGRYVRRQLDERGITTSVLMVRPARLDEATDDAILRVASVETLPADVDLMVDCAGHAALSEHGPAILRSGRDLVTVSLGALADTALLRALETAGAQGSARLHLASGAIGALDCLQAASVGGLDAVTYVGRKPPLGWKGSPAENVLDLDALQSAGIHFEGTAGEAAMRYPKNANVAAAVAIAGLGFDATKVRLIADPAVSANIHEVHAEGGFGQFSFHIEGRALPDNPRSSALAAMSVVAAIMRQRQTVTL